MASPGDGLRAAREWRHEGQRARDAVTSSDGASSRRSPCRYDDAGLGIVEVLISIVILIVVLLPTTDLLVTTQRAGADQRMSAEATNLASAELEDIERQAGVDKFTPPASTTYHLATNPSDANYNPTLPTQLGSDQLSTFYRVSKISAVSGGTSLCASPANSGPTQNYYLITVSIYKGNAYTSGTQVLQSGNGNPATLLTSVSTSLALAATTPITDGEVAVPVLNPLSSEPDTADDVWISLGGYWTGSGSAPSVPSNTVISATADTGTSGCAVFTNLDAQTGWQYTAAVIYCSGTVTSNCTPTSIVDFDENSANVNAPGTPQQTGITPSPGTLIVANPFYLGEGSTATLTFKAGASCTTTGCTTAPAATLLPSASRVTVSNQHLQCVSTSSVCVLGNGSTTVASSAAASLLLFPYSDGYRVWAGDSPESDPLNVASGASTPQYATVPPSLLLQTASNTAATATPNSTIWLYYAGFSLKYSSTAITGMRFTSVDGGADAYSFSQACKASPCTMQVALPLGEYSVTVTTASGAATLSSGGPGAPYVWVTPTGVCSSTDVTTPYTEIPLTTASVESCSGSGLLWTAGTGTITETLP